MGYSILFHIVKYSTYSKDLIINIPVTLLVTIVLISTKDIISDFLYWMFMVLLSLLVSAMVYHFVMLVIEVTLEIIEYGKFHHFLISHRSTIFITSKISQLILIPLVAYVISYLSS